jgi:hypothetical protein
MLIIFIYDKNIQIFLYATANLPAKEAQTINHRKPESGKCKNRTG